MKCGSQTALQSIDMLIPARAFTVIVGPSGSGKTTLLDLLCGLHTPQEGRILIDDRPLQQIGLQSWRRRIGYVPQDGVLFHDTILQNVTLGDESISEETAIKALREASAFSFISKLPKGIHTIVGERGSRLSGGQRQRIHIARALARNPDILLLDESTSAMDLKAEQYFMSLVKLIARNITVIAITHSASVMKYADHSFLIENGRLQD
jgi:ATP-binding cassette subfamily C protein